MSRIGNSGFTLLEIMISVVILSLGIVFIFEALLVSFDLVNYCSNSLKITLWMDEKIWQTQDQLSRFGDSASIEISGVLTNGNRDARWHLSHELIDEKELHKIDLVLFWREGQREIKRMRSAYAIFEKK